MKLTVLIDNNTLIDRYFIGEPGVCYYIEEDDQKILFDLGYSQAFLKNGDKMGVDFHNLDWIVVSHSHLDHTWGMEPLIKRFNEAHMEWKGYKRPKLIAHPDIFYPRSFGGEDEFGMLVGQDKVFKYLDNNLSSKPVWLTKNLVFLGEIPRINEFEAKVSIGHINIDGKSQEDFNLDDSALCYKSPQGLVIITGCSHAGICNIIEYAKSICQDSRIVDVIGGFHLQEPEASQLEGTVLYFGKQDVKAIHACHCTDLQSKIELSKVVSILEVGVGLELKY